MLDMIAKIANDSLRLDQLKPVQKTHQVVTSVDASGEVRVFSNNYKDKVRPGQVSHMSSPTPVVN